MIEPQSGVVDRVRSCDVWGAVLDFVDEASLVRLSAADALSHRSVTRRLFRDDTCVHCGAVFCLLDNRVEACLEIYNKPHRRHKGTRSASRRERRLSATLIENRKRIRRGWTPKVHDDAKETCALCRRDYLPWRISDDQWRQTVPRASRGRTICFPCYLSLSSSSRRPSSVVLTSLAALLLFLVWLSPPTFLSAAAGEKACAGVVREP
mmetsp:Transcript_26692/g.86438  ORF Transcript_26692/g.86438 Transcript_26692/m.86438 type:complete len:208 (+) Transcript_26692:48-671(+)|eukprot:CAMPEP_0118916812 /NCGR_PEP_ID=MMETSP1166-20130328/16733_1 /TAXON_ID=1104430 /ORGANISM="Chrysoreinhardia sp, Strain CCMP3193" /LENGTH=207 /DNA_ID=CAMNT_0006856741 /DNA_START=94 /DNA_END=717 /DNA_ORIENTATION=-